ncbi:carboxypeptidase-like regulatory domain-containing protein [Candidatus Palauibacter sp.]|uniref:carboxypeptidase-like regulatory domain-containing protein n=1 Tax=Candidatus Palauibacter sp. TaxID=3101350 RepID=UPI003B5183FA
MTNWYALVWAVVVAGLGLLLLATPLSAQETDARLRGLVLTEGSGTPVEGAHIQLVELGDVVLREALSDDRGAFSLPLPPPGVYRLRVERIGYQSWASDTLHVAATSESRVLRFEVPVDPIPLPELSVSQQNTCPTTPEERRRAFALYESVLPALASSSSTADLGNLLVQAIRPIIVGKYDYWRRNGGRRFQQDTATVVVPGSLNVLSPSSEHLVAYGYAEVVQDTLTTFYAPTGDAMASPGFLATHCLRTIESDDDARVGLGFEPRPGRELVDVRGVLWIDSITEEPEEVDFQYTSLRPFLRRHLLPPLKADILYRILQGRYPETKFHAIELDESEFGGVLYFEHIPGDRWLIREWTIRSPILYYRTRSQLDRQTVWPFASPLTTSGAVLAIVPP